MNSPARSPGSWPLVLTLRAKCPPLSGGCATVDFGMLSPRAPNLNCFRIVRLSNRLLSGAPLRLLALASLHEDVVCDCVPGVMNPHEKQQERGRSDGKKCSANMGASRVRRSSERRICHEREQTMKQPVLEFGPVGGSPHASNNHDLVNDPAKAQQAPNNGGRADRFPRNI